MKTGEFSGLVLLLNTTSKTLNHLNMINPVTTKLLVDAG
jgi:hypothetical protein